MLKLKKEDFKKVQACTIRMMERHRPDQPEIDKGPLDVPEHYLAERMPYEATPIEPERAVVNVFVPAAYMEEGTCCGFDAKTAPIFFYVAGGAFRYHRLSFLDGHGDVSYTIAKALERGFVVICADYRGCADRMTNAEGKTLYPGVAPAQLVDLKAALRWARKNSDVIPGDFEKIVVHGISSGGAMTQLVSASGNTHRLDAELKEVGALDGRDDVKAAVPYCGPGDLEHADMAMNWYFGRYLYEPTMEEVFNPGKQAMESLPRVTHDADGKPVLRIDYKAQKNAYDCYDAYAKAYVDEFIVGELGLTEAQYIAEILNILVPSYQSYRATNPQDCTGDYFWWESYEDYLAQGNAPDPYYDKTLYPQSGYINFDLYRIWCADVAADVAKPTPAFDKLKIAEMPGSENALFGTRETGFANFTKLGAAQSELGIGTLPESVQRVVTNQNPLSYVPDAAADKAQLWSLRHGVLDGDIPFPLSFNLMRALRKAGKQAELVPLWKRRHLDCCKGEQDVAALLDCCMKLVEE
jgi:acetyl esterase/lipase